MTKAYSEDLRERVIVAVEAGATRRAAAAQFKVSVSSAIRWVRRWHVDWEIAAKPRGGSVSPLEDHAAAVVALAAEQPDLTLDEFCAVLRERKIETSRVSVWRFFSRHGLSFKKRMARPVRKWLMQGDLIGLRQRIRSRSSCPGQDGGPRTPVSHKIPGVKAPFF
jgi:transposase